MCIRCKNLYGKWRQAVAVDTFLNPTPICERCILLVQLDELYLPRVFLGYSEDGGD